MDNIVIRLIVALVVAAVIVWLLPFGPFIVGLIALAAFLLILFAPMHHRTTGTV
jgi:uncharacterized membrane protein